MAFSYVHISRRIQHFPWLRRSVAIFDRHRDHTDGYDRWHAASERLHSCKTNGWRAEIQARVAMVGNEIETREREQIKTATLARTELPEAMRPGAAWASSTSTVDYDYDEVDYDYEQPPPPPPRPEQNLRSGSEWSSRWGGRETGAEESQLPSPKRPRLHDASSESAATGITGHIAAEQVLASLDPGRDGSPPDVGRPERDSNGAVQQQLLEVQQEVHQRLREALSRQQQIQIKLRRTFKFVKSNHVTYPRAIRDSFTRLIVACTSH